MDKKEPEFTIESLSEEIKNLRIMTATADRIALKAEESARKAQVASNAQIRQIAQFEAVINGQTLKLARAEIEELHRVYKLAHVKMTVATEAVFLCQMSPKTAHLRISLAHAAIRAFDLDDSWWEKRRNYNLGRWLEILLEIHEQGLPNANVDLAALAKRRPGLAP